MADAIPVHAPKTEKVEKAPKAGTQAPAGAKFKELQDAAHKEGKSAFVVHGDPKAQPALRIDN